MLKPESRKNLPAMSAEAIEKYRRAVAEEAATKNENVAASRAIAVELKAQRKVISDLVARLRVARETAGVSLNKCSLAPESKNPRYHDWKTAPHPTQPC